MQVVWLASYPKSGNTWLRFLIYNYLHGELEDRSAVGRTLPDIHNMGGYEPPEDTGRVFIKTHFRLGPKHPLMEFTRGFIYVLRDPRDVLLSNLNYYRLGAQGQFDEVAFAKTFIARMGVPQWIDIGAGNWVQHAASWLDGLARMPGLVLRYEDIKADPEGQMTRVAEFIDGKADPDRVRRAVAASSLSSMREMEEREHETGKDSAEFVINPQNAASGARFVNEGRSGQSLAALSEEMENAFRDRFGEACGLLGYA